MGRSTFEGPILSGDNRFGPLRNVGYSLLVQHIDVDLTVTTPNTALYGGASGVFVESNDIPNTIGPVFTPSTSFPPTRATLPADTATNVYRGFVFYLPIGCDLEDVLIDVVGLPTVAGGTAAITSSTFYIGNSFTAAGGTPAYFATGAITAIGRQPLAAFTAQQMINQAATSIDIVQQNGQPAISQVVGTLAIVGTALDTRTSLTGRYAVSLRYVQPDGNIGNQTVYPYGNFD